MFKGKANWYDLVFLIGFILWVGETAYFGFNRTPESDIEKFFDIASVIIMVYGLVQSWAYNLTRPYVSNHNISITEVSCPKQTKGKKNARSKK